MCRPPCPGGASSFETARCCGQLVALRFIKGRRRTSMLALCAAGALSWAVIASSDSVDGWVAVALVVGLGMFGLGETLWAPVAPAIVNDLAPEELRGRYDALRHDLDDRDDHRPRAERTADRQRPRHLWVAFTVGGTAIAALLFLDLRRHLSRAQDGLGPEVVLAA